MDKTMKQQLREHANAHRNVNRDWEVSPGVSVTGRPTIYVRFGRHFTVHLQSGTATRIADALIDAVESGQHTKYQHRAVERSYAIADAIRAEERRAT